MNRVRMVTATAALCGSVLTASEAAACAWVLWSETIVTLQGTAVVSREWQMISATDASAAECAARRAKFIQDAVATGSKLVGGAIQHIEGVKVILQCIPNTIDPRGPKGGTR